jgi:hypothetical protein
LIIGAGNYNVILWPSYAEWKKKYTEGITCGLFSYPLKPTFMYPLPYYL